MTCGLNSVQRRQRTLAQGVLALVCAAWLQTAITPCVMAHGSGSGPPPESVSHHRHDADAVHDHAAPAVGEDLGTAERPCVYCPPDDADGDTCAGHGGCAYPHDPQVDARGAGALFTALPLAFVVHLPVEPALAHLIDPAVREGIPRISLSVSFCRFIE